MKKLLLVCAVAMVAFALAACGGGNAGGNEAGGGEAAANQSAYVGSYVCTQYDPGMGDDFIVAAADMDTTDTLVINADGTADAVLSGETMTLDWAETETGLSFTAAGTEVATATMAADGSLLFDLSGMIVYTFVAQ